MPPQVNSRFQFCTGQADTSGRFYLSEREPYRFREFDDNIRHVVRDGDTLHSIAARYFDGLDSPALFWWIVADFQPDPILDPTIQLDAGRVLTVPSLRTVHEEIFSEARRDLT